MATSPTAHARRGALRRLQEAQHRLRSGGDATNQNHSSCTALAAPVVTRSMTPTGVELSWAPVTGPAEYRIYRGELGCNRQQVPHPRRFPPGKRPTSTTAWIRGATSLPREAFGTKPGMHQPGVELCERAAGSRVQKSSSESWTMATACRSPEKRSVCRCRSPISAPTQPSLVSARLGLVAPADVRILRPTASWPTIAPRHDGGEPVPHFEIVVLDQAELAARS